MPKSELLAFIQKKQREGLSQEDIIYKLTSHGWPLVEIHEGFNYLAVMTSNEQFEVPASHELPLPSHPEMPMVTTRTPQSFFNPTMITGVLMVLIAGFITTGFIFLNPVSPASRSFAIAGVILSVVSTFIGGAVLNLITRILDIPERSLAKAFVFTGIGVIVAFLLGLLPLAGIPRFVAPIASIAFGFAFFCYYYRADFLKGLAAVGLSIVFGIAISVIMSVIGFFFGISLFNFISFIPQGPTNGFNINIPLNINQGN